MIHMYSLKTQGLHGDAKVCDEQKVKCCGRVVILLSENKWFNMEHPLSPTGSPLSPGHTGTI